MNQKLISEMVIKFAPSIAKVISVGNRMFLGMQDFDFTQI